MNAPYSSLPEWPALPLEEWKTTYATLHRWTQIAGKVPLELSPFANHYWHVPFYVSARGLRTSVIPYGTELLEIEFDFLAHACNLRTSRDEHATVPLYARSVADFYAEFMDDLSSLGISVHIWPMPVEITEAAIRFDQDTIHCDYDRDAVGKLFRILTRVDRVFESFRSRFIGKSSPVQFYWGSFDLTTTRFSGRRAPDRDDEDPITRESYSHEVMSCGFWPGAGIGDAAFYAYAAPEPAGFSTARIEPSGAFYHAGLREFLLPYEEVRASSDPDATILAFCQSTYEAGANLGNWDRAELERSAPVSKRVVSPRRLGPTAEASLHPRT